ncbi:MAG: iron ABC transporter permease [Alphaproteobacteria bacterium]|nr:iron ABC transporter permease [Alphaproteobacteria bacterium]
MDAIKRWRLTASLSLVLAALGVVSLFAGRVAFPPAEIARAVFAPGDLGEAVGIIVWDLRLPRTLLAILVGASLGLAGAALQGLLRNPLAEPGVIGVSTSAAFGAVVVFYSGLAGAFPIALPLGGMVGALGAVALLILMAGRNPGVLTLILAGVAINSLGGALTALALNLSPNPYAAAEVVFWLMGSLADRSFEHVQLAAIFMVPGWLLIFSARRALDALSLGDDAAASLGFDLRAARWLTVSGVALAVGAAVSVCGTIAFVGLVVPHVLRPLVGYEPSRLLPASGLGGAILLVVTDIAVRVLSVGIELKIGVLTALIGAPFFFALLIKLRRVMR